MTKSIDECTEEQLFNSLYKGLAYMSSVYGVPEPNVVWSEALECLNDLDGNRRPDIVIHSRYGIHPSATAMTVIGVILYMLEAKETGEKPKELIAEIVEILKEYGESWMELYQQFRKSEGVEEEKGRFVEEFDYRVKSEAKMKLTDEEMSVLDEILGYAKKGCWELPATDENVDEWLRTMFGVGKCKLDESDLSVSRAFRAFFIDGKGKEKRAIIAFSNVLGFMFDKKWLKGKMKSISLMFFNNENQHININNGKPKNASGTFTELMPFMEKYAKRVIR